MIKSTSVVKITYLCKIIPKIILRSFQGSLKGYSLDTHTRSDFTVIESKNFDRKFHSTLGNVNVI